MSTEPPYILNNFSDLNIIGHWVPSYYTHAEFGLAPIFSM